MSQRNARLLVLYGGRCSGACRYATFCTFLLYAYIVSPALATTFNWTDGSVANSNWSEPGNWSPSGPPGFSDDAVVSSGLLGTVGPAIVSANASVGSLELTNVPLNGAGEVDILSGNDLVINAGDMVNNGLIVINSDSSNQTTRLRFSAYAGDNLLTLSGTGTILMQADSQPFPVVISPATIETISSVVTQEAGHTIRGVGQISASIVNNGNILATDVPTGSGHVLELTGSGITNNATLGAEADGYLRIVGSYPISQGKLGVISAADGGTVELLNNVLITGGTLQSKGTGVVFSKSSPSNSYATRLTDVSNEGMYQVNTGGTAFIAGGGLTNNGTVNLDGTMNYLNNGALGGTGEVVMSVGGKIDNQVGVTILHSAGHTIRGQGQVNALLTNEGVIQADGTLQLVFDPITNNNEIRAASGGTLQVENQVTQNPSSGFVIAEDGGTVKLMSSGRLIGGHLQSFGSGIIQAGDNFFLRDVVNDAILHTQPLGFGAQVNIEGAGLTNNGTIVVNPLSQGGTFRLTVCCDPQMTLDGGGVLDLHATNSTLLVAGGTALTNAAGHTIKGPGRIEGAIVNEGLLTGGTIAGPVDMLQVANLLSGTGDLNDVRITGTHAPGDGIGITPASGIYELTSGTLEIEIGGTTAGSGYDAVQSTGAVIINNSTLDVTLTGGFAPNSSNSFTIITATGGGGVSGTGFTHQNLPDLPGGLYFGLSQGVGSVTLSVEGVLGDYNKNGVVDAADYIVWREMFGQMGSGLAADGSRDGKIDKDDYDAWRTAFGQVAPGSAAGNGVSSFVSVPEPTAFSLLLSAGVSLLIISRQKQSPTDEV